MEGLWEWWCGMEMLHGCISITCIHLNLLARASICMGYEVLQIRLCT